jgi:hypothetical protein
LELTLAYLDRADQSGTTLALIFAASSAAFGLVMKEGVPSHWPSLLLFGLSVVAVYFSWERQKVKAINRFKSLRDGRIADYLALGAREPNIYYDRIAGALLVVGAGLEAAIRALG